MSAFTYCILMIRPACFGYNPQTSVSNVFQKMPTMAENELQKQAVQEFDRMVDQLQQAGIIVEVVQDTAEPCKPDAVFPNNWISFHENGEVIIYPMMAPNRRLEKRKDIISFLEQKGYQVNKVTDLSHYEAVGKFLEGTGSMVLDRAHRIIYACLSDRTHEELLHVIADAFQYQIICFHASDEKHRPIYHTNVMMAIGKNMAVICADSIHEESEKKRVMASLHAHHENIIQISFLQMHQYAGNLLYLLNQEQEPVIVMSHTGYVSLSPNQKQQLEKCGQLVLPKIPVIEQTGGGSVRCMIAEIFLPHS
jgi:hypothetical protein